MRKLIITNHFLREVKPLRRKYRDIDKKIIEVIENFNRSNSDIILGNVFKLRFSSDFIKKGKSKSFRLIIWVWESDCKLLPLTIYYKGDKSNISENEIYFHERRVNMDVKCGNYREYI